MFFFIFLFDNLYYIYYLYFFFILFYLFFIFFWLRIIFLFFDKNRAFFFDFNFFAGMFFDEFGGHLVAFYREFNYIHFKDYYFWRFFKKKDKFLKSLKNEAKMYIWDVHDVFGDSLYSFNVRDRIMSEGEIVRKPGLIERLFTSKKKKKWKPKRLYDFSLFYWWFTDTNEYEDPLDDYDHFDASETFEYYERLEEVYKREKRRRYSIKYIPFRKFWERQFYHFTFKPARSYDLVFWKLFYGITYAVRIPFFLEILYRPDIWDFLRSYFFFCMDLPWDFFIWRTSMRNHVALNKMNFFAPHYFDGVREATFDSSLFSSYYEYSYELDDIHAPRINFALYSLTFISSVYFFLYLLKLFFLVFKFLFIFFFF